MTLPSSSASLTVGEKMALTATVLPDNATDKKEKWVVASGSDKVKLYTDEACENEVGTAATDVLTVYAQGIAAGDALIDVASNESSTIHAQCAITVAEPETPAEPIDLTPNADGTEWTLAEMPEYNVELEVECYDEVTLTDGNAISELNDYKEQEIWVNYTRSFTSGTTSTVCLPFAYTKKEGDGSFYAFTNIEKEGGEYVATMTEPVSTTLTANTPYQYVPNATGAVDFGGAYTIPAELEAGSTTNNGWTFKGTFTEIKWAEAPTDSRPRVPTASAKASS